MLGRLLAEAGDLTLLVTSRERLHLRDEWTIELGGLSLPDDDAWLEQAEAVQLFVERARHVSPQFALDSHNRLAVAHICRRMEGMPLAIELAAAWTRVLTPSEIVSEIVSEIDHALDLLGHAGDDAPERHRSIRAALDHSWRLLDASEQRALARLALFRGHFERDAATEIAGATLPILLSLIDKSLVRRETNGTISRFSLHELVRQYAAERLSEQHDRAASEQRFIAFYAALLANGIDSKTGNSTAEARATIQRNIENIRAAWVRASEIHDSAAIVSMMVPLRIWYDNNSWLQPGATLFGQAAEAFRTAETHVLYGYLLAIQGYFLTRIGQFRQARPILETSRAILEPAGANDGLTVVVFNLGMLQFHLAQPDQAEINLVHAQTLVQAQGDSYLALWSELWLGAIALIRGEYDRAEAMYRHFTDAWHTIGFSRGEAVGFVLLGELEYRRGDVAQATVYLRDGLRIGAIARDTLATGLALSQLGSLAMLREEWDEAYYLLTEGSTMLREMGDHWNTGRALTYLMHVEIARGNDVAAARICAELTQFVVADERFFLAEAALGFALLLGRANRYAEAWQLLSMIAPLQGDYATLKRAAELANQWSSRIAAHEIGPERELLAWLQHLAKHPWTKAVTTPQAPKPVGLHISATNETLSPREVEVLRLLIGGATNPAIAEALVISPFTAKHHVGNVLQKLGVTSRTQAAVQGKALGLEPLIPQPHD